MWSKVSREKAAGGYPWTHLNTNQQDEIWINPLNLPQDITRETLRRKDGTLPPDWFHLPTGAETPSVEELLRDSPEPELEILSPDLTETSPEEPSSGQKTPGGRRTPIRGKHRHRHCRSTGSSPGPPSSPGQHQRTSSQPEGPPAPGPAPGREDQQDGGGYEPVGQPRPSARPPDSELPTIPSQEEAGQDGGEAGQGCFPLRRSRSRSKSKKRNVRSPSSESDPSHPYETPKFLPKLQKHERQVKPEETFKEPSYEPVGLKIDETENIDMNIVHFSRENKTDNPEGDGENSSKTDGKSFIVTVIDRIKTLSGTRDTERHQADDNTEELISKHEEEEKQKTIAKEEKRRKKKEQEDEEKMLKLKKIEEQQALQVKKQEEQARLDQEKKEIKILKKLKEEEDKRTREEEKKLKEAEERRAREELKLANKIREEEKKQLKLARKEEKLAEKIAKEEEQRIQKQKLEEAKKQSKLPDEIADTLEMSPSESFHVAEQVQQAEDR